MKIKNTSAVEKTFQQNKWINNWISGWNKRINL